MSGKAAEFRPERGMVSAIRVWEMNRPGTEIMAIEYALPDQVETNEDLQRLYPHWDIEGVYQKTGVRQRHIAGPDECASDLAYRACSRLFEKHGVAPSEIDGLIVCTQSPDYVMPHTAALLQQRLSLGKSVAAFDYSLACSGYVYGLAICKAFIESGVLESILFVTCDTYSKYIRPDDRGARTLFGDGGSVTLVRKGTPGVREISLGTDGSGAEKFIVRGGGCRNGMGRGDSVAAGGRDANARYIEMDGFGVLSFVKKEIPPFVEQLLSKSGLHKEEIDQFIFHQASRISLEQVAQILGLRQEKVLINFENIGNTVSASIPIALKTGWQTGQIQRGMTVMLVGFGVGFSWAGAIVHLTDNFMRGER